ASTFVVELAIFWMQKTGNGVVLQVHQCPAQQLAQTCTAVFEIQRLIDIALNEDHCWRVIQQPLQPRLGRSSLGLLLPEVAYIHCIADNLLVLLTQNIAAQSVPIAPVRSMQGNWLAERFTLHHYLSQPIQRCLTIVRIENGQILLHAGTSLKPQFDTHGLRQVRCHTDPCRRRSELSPASIPATLPRPAALQTLLNAQMAYSRTQWRSDQHQHADPIGFVEERR